MVTAETFREWALLFPETAELPHFEKTSFRVGKKIFATYDAAKNQACLRFSEIDQSVFVSIDREAIFPVPNKWGKQGWTLINLAKVQPDLFREALRTAFCEVAPKKLAAPFISDSWDK